MSEKKEEVGVMLDFKDGPPEAESLPDICPKCGSETMFGYGLAGGGMGAYVMCDGPEESTCDFFAKKYDKE